MENPLDQKVRVSWGKPPGANSLIMRTVPSSYVQCGRPFSARAKEMGEGDKMVFLPAFRDGEHHATGYLIKVCPGCCNAPWAKAVFEFRDLGFATPLHFRI